MKEYFMKMAYCEAKKAYKNDEIPVGCVIVCENEIVACGCNKKERKNNALMHAEIIAIDKACRKLGSWRLDNCDIYVTLEPCMMCMGAIIESRIRNVYYGTKSKGEQMYVSDKIDGIVNLYYVNDVDCSKILSDFFINKRKK